MAGASGRHEDDTDLEWTGDDDGDGGDDPSDM